MVENSPNPVRIIAEIANTHNGSLERAESLVRFAASADADTIKFQVFKADDLVSPAHPEYSIFKKLALLDSNWRFLFSLAQELNLTPYADVFSVDSLSWLVESGCQGFKIHSSDCHNLPLLREVGRMNLPVLVSLGGITPKDTWQAANQLMQAGCREITLMLGFQAFPTSLEDCRLRSLTWYKQQFGLPVGYADHTDTDHPMALTVPLLAIAAGASTIEKHLTIDRKSKPDDYEASIEPDQFAVFVKQIREVEVILGRKGLPIHSAAEKSYAKAMKKYPLVAKTIAPGESLQLKDVKFQRIFLQDDLYPANLDFLAGKKAVRKLSSNSLLRNQDFDLKVGILIAVRSNSTRLPNKALLQIQGKPVIAHLIERMKKSRLAHMIILCTTTHSDDDPLIAVAQSQEILYFRGDEEDVMGRFLGAAKKFGVDIIVRVTGDDVFSDPAYIDRAISTHLKVNAEITSVSGLPNGVDREVISVPALSWIHQHAKNRQGTEYMTWYLDEPAFIHQAHIRADPAHYRPDYRLTLDTPADWMLIRWLFSQLSTSKKADGNLDEIIPLLDANPKITAMNAKPPPKLSKDDIETGLNLRFATYPKE